MEDTFGPLLIQRTIRAPEEQVSNGEKPCGDDQPEHVDSVVFGDSEQ